MNKFKIIKMITQAPALTPAQEFAKIAALIAATCLAAKIEDIIIELAKEANTEILDKIPFEEVK